MVHPAGFKLVENLQSRVKEEDSITDVENAVSDLGVMDSLGFLFIDQRGLVSFCARAPTEDGHAFPSLTSMEYTDGVVFVNVLELGYSFARHSVRLEVLGLTLPQTAPTAKSLASHMISKGKSNQGATRIEFMLQCILREDNGVSFFKGGS
ncbi:hypothetical protein Tco_0646163 [Tanacetum coccineum]